MTTSAWARFGCAALLLLPAVAWGAVAAGALPVVLAQADASRGAPDGRADEGADPAPPPPEAVPAPPPQQQPRGPGAQAAGRAGQWVHTEQYGWIWMPYGDAYTYAPPDGYGEPYAYVYAPVYGWTWVVAPWVWGYGPWPFFGVHGPFYFAWYRHGWWRSPWRFHFAGGFRGGFAGRGGGGFAPHAWRSAPARGGWAGRGAAGGRGVAVHGGGGARGGGRGHR